MELEVRSERLEKLLKSFGKPAKADKKVAGYSSSKTAKNSPFSNFVLPISVSAYCDTMFSDSPFLRGVRGGFIE